MEPNRVEAMRILEEYVKNPNLIKHALAVEAAMRFYARKFGEDEEKWGIVGLLHDFDYEKYPDPSDHPYRGVEILREKGYSEEILRGIMSHAPHTGTTPETLMEKTILAVDELTGFLVACALVRPSKKIAEVKPKSVKKRMKEKAFARAVNREDIVRGAELLNTELSEHIQNVIDAMSQISVELGL
jgi:putative nucleotidyltransferase with HDIG domain